MIKDFEQFLTESHDKDAFPVDLALIVFKFFYDNEKLLDRSEIYMSLNDRAFIKKYYKERLPKNFPGPEKDCHVSDILNNLVGSSPGCYFDDADLVIPTDGDNDIVFRCEVKNRRITSTWKDLGDFLSKDDQILKLWLAHKDYDLENFRKSAKVKVIRFGI